MAPQKQKSRSVLLIEDDQLTCEVLIKVLQSNGFTAVVVGYGEEAQALLQKNFDIIILDLVLPDRDGLQVLHEFRAWNSTTPVLILSGLAAIEDKLAGLDGGADDYVTKPFDHRELVLRLQALLRRSADAGMTDRLALGGLQLDDAQHCAYYFGKKIPFTHKEYLIVRALAESRDTPLTKQDLLNLMYRDSDKKPKLKIIDVFIFKIRIKLEKATHNKLRINTLWGVGLQLDTVDDPERVL